jgi:thiol:disulfide interchange protein DsbA
VLSQRWFVYYPSDVESEEAMKSRTVLNALPVNASRRKTAQALGLGLCGAALAGPWAEPAQAIGFDEGIDYARLPRALPIQKAGAVEVIEFFWYACGHCFALEPHLKAWLQKLPPQVAFRKEHVAFRGTVHQQLFYTLQVMGLESKLGPSVFDTIHVRQRPMSTFETLVMWAEEQRVSEADFTRAWRSSEVAARMARGSELMRAHQVDGVPRFTVQGLYITSPAMAGGSHQRALQVLNHLIQKVS